MKIIAITNQKGGVGKTTSAVSISGELAGRGNKVLLIDLDPQGNASSALRDIGETIEDDKVSKFLKGEPDDNMFMTTRCENLYLMPTCCKNLYYTMRQFESNAMKRSDILLDKAIKRMDEEFDYIILDCSPAENIMSLNALVCADYVLIPIKLDMFSLDGFNMLLDNIYAVKEERNEKLEILGIFSVMYRNTKLNDVVMGSIMQGELKKFLFDTKIRINTKIEECPFEQIPIGMYDSKASAAIDYKKLTNEILGRIGEYQCQN